MTNSRAVLVFRVSFVLNAHLCGETAGASLQIKVQHARRLGAAAMDIFLPAMRSGLPSTVRSTPGLPAALLHAAQIQRRKPHFLRDR